MGRLRLKPLTRSGYRRYGDVIEALGRGRLANQGTARRFDFLAELRNLRRRAKPNLCVFRARPFRGRVFQAKLLERHPRSTQVFLPMGGVRRYLVLVALGRSRPDLATLSAFLASGRQGVSYRPGVWHHPLVALDGTGDFACLVWEDGTRGDGELARLRSAPPIAVF